jgi:hypothetical protein
MPDITKQTPRKEATIKGVRLSVPVPYTEGHVLTGPEATTLNQTWIENIRNNLSNEINELIEAAGGIEKFDSKAGQKLVDEYAKDYEFYERKGGGFRSSDPVEAEAMNIARGKVRDAIRNKGLKLSEVPTAKVTELARKLLDKNPALRERAKKIVEARQESAEDINIDLSDV